MAKGIIDLKVGIWDTQITINFTKSTETTTVKMPYVKWNKRQDTGNLAFRTFKTKNPKAYHILSRMVEAGIAYDDKTDFSIDDVEYNFGT